MTVQLGTFLKSGTSNYSECFETSVSEQKCKYWPLITYLIFLKNSLTCTNVLSGKEDI